MNKTCANCGWLWNEEQTPIIEDNVNYCPVCDSTDFTEED
ncbi:zinc ribbon domain protein [Bacillus phage 035JT004]|nr:zinc ribbon domain protein [Bacillus phage 035JT004]